MVGYLAFVLYVLFLDNIMWNISATGDYILFFTVSNGEFKILKLWRETQDSYVKF